MHLVYERIRGVVGRVLSRASAMGAMLALLIVLTAQWMGSPAQSPLTPPMLAEGSFSSLQNAPGGPGGAQFHAVQRVLPSQEDSTDKTVVVTITADGQTTELEVQNGCTVEEILDEQNIVLGEYDVVTPKLNQQIKRDREIVVNRVEYTFETVEETVPFETNYKESSLLHDGKAHVVQQGAEGYRQVTYATRIVDGEPVSEQELQVEMLAEPAEEIVLVGAPVAISPLVFDDVQLDENGAPLEYSQLLTNQIATGYSARKGAKTASGRNAITGHVAVDPKEIPYGSRLYITSADNSFVYGYAIAADTGVGLMQDIIDVDLFYDTYRESAMNGRKIVNIYVLD